MSVDLSKLLVKKKITLEELKDNIIAVDAYNTLFQFLSIIRQPDGTPLMDAHGNVTSHLSGLFYRSIELIQNDIKLVYVFDGIPSMLKQKTIEARMRRRSEALKAWQAAKEAGEIEEARAHAQASTRIDKNIVEGARALLDMMGIPYINAPSEGEAQASHMARKGTVDAVISQDYDTLLFGAPRILRNINISGKRKLPRKEVYITVEPEEVSLEGTLGQLGVSQEQLIWIGILLGTDFNDGIKGVGPKTALKIARSAKSIDDIKDYVKTKYNTEFELDIREVEQLFLNPEVSDVDREYILNEVDEQPNQAELIKFMCDEHGFSRERIERYVSLLASKKGSARQRGLNAWFK